MNHLEAQKTAVKAVKKCRAHLVIAAHHTREAEKANAEIERVRKFLTPAAAGVIDRVLDGADPLALHELNETTEVAL